MDINAIVYVSNTGYTKRYAMMLSKKLGIKAYELKEAKKELKKKESIIYLGWLFAGSVKGFKKAKRRFDVKALCGVGLGATGAQNEAVRSKHKLEKSYPVFTIQGGMDRENLTGLNKFMINMLDKMLTKKDDRTEEENAMLELIKTGGDFVSENELYAVYNYLNISEEE